MAGLPAAPAASGPVQTGAAVPPGKRDPVHAFPGEAGGLLDGGLRPRRGAVGAGAGRSVPAHAGT